MHPILNSVRRLLLYLSAWGPISAILIYLFASLGGFTWKQSLVLAFPLCAVYAFVCLSAWYTCRSLPFDNSSAWLPHAAAACIASFLWIFAARAIASALSLLPSFAGMDQRVSRIYPLLFGSGVFLYLLAVALYYVLLSSQAAHEAEKNAVEARVLARDSELKALKTQVNPHFIFNCLNSISALTSSDPAKAREMCVLLGDFLRKTLGLGEKALIPLRDELALLHAYLSVEQIRFGNRLRLEESTDPDVLDCLLPPLLLQPMIENAVAHGVAHMTEGGWIRLQISSRSARNVNIEIENNFDPEAPKRRGAGIGLKNVRQRLSTSYGSRADFDVRTNHDRFLVSLNLPAEREA